MALQHRFHSHAQKVPHQSAHIPLSAFTRCAAGSYLPCSTRSRPRQSSAWTTGEDRTRTVALAAPPKGFQLATLRALRPPHPTTRRGKPCSPQEQGSALEATHRRVRHSSHTADTTPAKPVMRVRLRVNRMVQPWRQTRHVALALSVPSGRHRNANVHALPAAQCSVPEESMKWQQHTRACMHACGR